MLLPLALCFLLSTVSAGPQQQQQEYSQATRQLAARQPLAQLPEDEEFNLTPSYAFSFNVENNDFTNYQSRDETSDNGVITGSYKVVDPDGFIRTVKYTADPEAGFQAQVVREPTDIKILLPERTPLEEQNLNAPSLQRGVIRARPVARPQAAAPRPAAAPQPAAPRPAADPQPPAGTTPAHTTRRVRPVFAAPQGFFQQPALQQRFVARAQAQPQAPINVAPQQAPVRIAHQQAPFRVAAQQAPIRVQQAPVRVAPQQTPIRVAPQQAPIRVAPQQAPIRVAAQPQAPIRVAAHQAPIRVANPHVFAPQQLPAQFAAAAPVRAQSAQAEAPQQQIASPALASVLNAQLGPAPLYSYSTPGVNVAFRLPTFQQAPRPITA